EGQWNDLPKVEVFDSRIAGYLVEYGGVGGCTPDFTDEAIVTIIVTENIVECDIAIGGVSTTSEPCDGTDFGAIDVNAVCSSCTEEPLYSIDGGASFQSISLFRVPAGTYTVVIRDATDETCISAERVVVVEVGADTEAPQFPGAENVPLQSVDPCADIEQLPIVYDANLVTDDCDNSPVVDVQIEVVTVNDTITSGGGDDDPRTTITELGQQINYIYTAIDASGNESAKTIPTWFIPVDEAPSINIANNPVQDVLNVCGEYPISADNLGVTATDDCTQDLEIEISIVDGNGQPIEAITEAGLYFVTARTTDETGKTDSENFTLNLEGNPDVITVTANDDNLSVPEGETITFNVLSNDFASDGSALEVQDLVLANPADGTLVDNGDGTFDFTPAEGFVGEVILTYITKSEDASLFFEGTGNFYEFVNAPGLTWEEARMAAEGRQLNGVSGYLATVTSEEENGFVVSKLEGEGWIGASDVAVEGEWRWVTGPEGQMNNGQGLLFWMGEADGIPANNAYINWASGEPNDFQDTEDIGEDYGHYFANGTWNDFPSNGFNVVEGYVVEYGGIDGCTPDFTDEATVTITVTENIDNCEDDTEAPTITGYSVGTLSDGQIEQVFTVEVDLDGQNILPVACGLTKSNEGNISRTIDIADNCTGNDLIVIAADELEVDTLEDGSLEVVEFVTLTDLSGNVTEFFLTTIYLSDTEAPVLTSCTVDTVILQVDEAGRVVGREEGFITIFEFDDFISNLTISDDCSPSFFVEYSEAEDGSLIEGGTGRIFGYDGVNFSEEVCDVIIVGRFAPSNEILAPQEGVGKVFGSAIQITTAAIETRSEISESFKVEVSPNPFQTEASLQVNLPTEEMVNIDMRDISGRLVKSLSMKGNAGENTFLIQGDNLATGVYFISIRTASTKQTVKVVVTQ
ncbi:MAG: T9SS type A sorting domain-containing protein, partial [Bacteroidota bacterium]